MKIKLTELSYISEHFGKYPEEKGSKQQYLLPKN